MKEAAFDGPEGETLLAQAENLWKVSQSPKPFLLELRKGESWARVGMDLDLFKAPVQGWVTQISRSPLENGEKILITIQAELYPMPRRG